MVNLIKKVEEAFKVEHKSLPDFRVGDTVCVHVKIQEKTKERIQQFQGIVIRIQGHKAHLRYVTVRKVKNQIAVERIFPIPSVMVDTVEVKQQGVVRQSRIFYVRDKKGSAGKIKRKIG